MNPPSGVNPALARLQASVRTGGKGTVRRKKKVVHKTTTTDDKRLQNTLKRLGINSIPAIEEVNLFMESGEVIHFTNPKVQASIAAPARWREEAQEEDLHQAQEDQAHLQVRQAQGAPVLLRGRLGQGRAQEEGVPRGELRARRLHGRPLRPPLLRALRSHLRLREVEGRRVRTAGGEEPGGTPLPGVITAHLGRALVT